MGDTYRRPRERERERDPKDTNVEFFGGGESYRPGGHTGQGPYRPAHAQPREAWSERREPRDTREPRRDVRREDIDSYVPPTSARARRDSRSPPPPRTRDRTPPPRDRGDLFPEQTRSPARRYSPRRDERPRSPPRRRSRSPVGRPRSPDRRGRDYTPPRSPRRDRSPRYDRARSPPRRAYSPPRDARRYRSRSRSPRRAYNEDTRRRRSPSPRADSSGPSRRSSPPLHPDRASITGSAPRSPYRQSPPRESRNGDFQPPSGPARNGYDRAPPSGPSRTFSASQTPPAGPAGYRAPPAGPRGGGDRFDSPRRDYANPLNRGRTSLTYRAPTAPRAPTYGEAPVGPSSTPPSGPRSNSFNRGDYSSSASGRGDYSAPGRGDYRPSYPARQPDFPFRPSNNSTSTTYPRTQRFNSVQQHLSTTEKILPGGKLLPSGLTPDQEKKMRQLEAEAERMRTEIAEKQAAKREGVNEWETRQRESSRDAYRSELADDGLKALGDTEEMAAF